VQITTCHSSGLRICVVAVYRYEQSVLKIRRRIEHAQGPRTNPIHIQEPAVFAQVRQPNWDCTLLFEAKAPCSLVLKPGQEIDTDITDEERRMINDGQIQLSDIIRKLPFRVRGTSRPFFKDFICHKSSGWCG
jgi:hypothetical protein